MSPELLAEILLLGSVIGVVIGLTGAGGGILAVPMLVFGLGLTMHEAAPAGLLAAGLASAVGAFMAWRAHVLRYRAALLVAAVGIVTVPLGVWLAHRLPNAPLLVAFAALLTFTGLRTLLSGGRTSTDLSRARCVTHPEHGRLQWNVPCARVLAATGAICGVLSGLLGVGGGFVIVPALRRYSNLEMDSIIATSMGIVALLSVGSVASASLAGAMPWPLALPFAGAALPGVLVGRRYSARLGGRRLQQAFAVVSLLVAVLLVVRAAQALRGLAA